jgi:hypothetical protein
MDHSKIRRTQNLSLACGFQIENASDLSFDVIRSGLLPAKDQQLAEALMWFVSS